MNGILGPYYSTTYIQSPSVCLLLDPPAVLRRVRVSISQPPQYIHHKLSIYLPDLPERGQEFQYETGAFNIYQRFSGRSRIVMHLGKLSRGWKAWTILRRISEGVRS
jgi:hypothetical protein